MFAKIIGNQYTKIQLMVAAASSIKSNDAMPHTMFEGSAGCGKTSMGKALAGVIEVPFIQEDPTALKTAGDVIRLASKFPTEGYDKNGKICGGIIPPVVFLDEIHNLSLKGQENLGLAMENWCMPISKGRTGKMNSSINIPRFTLVGATTLIGKLSKPFVDRFKLSFKFNVYNLMDSLSIVKVHAKRLEIEIELLAAVEIAVRGRGVPRILVRFLERARDFSSVANKKIIDINTVETMFNIMGIDQCGLTRDDVKLLKCLYDNKDPVGVDTLSILINEATSTITHSMEPYLIQKRFILRTPKGRTITMIGAEYLEEVHDYE